MKIDFINFFTYFVVFHRLSPSFGYLHGPVLANWARCTWAGVEQW